MKSRRIPSLLIILFSLLFPVQAASSTLPEEDREAEIRVLSFNIRYGSANDGFDSWQFRRGFVIQLIKDSRAGIIGLQEALRFQIDEIHEGLENYGEVGVGRDDGVTAGEYSALLYDRQKFELRDEGTFWYSDTPEQPGSKDWGNTITRICTWARFLELASSCEFYVFNTHFDHRSQPSRERSALLLQERIVSREVSSPVIVTGDFNSGESNPAILFLTQEAPLEIEEGLVRSKLRLQDSFRKTHPGAQQVGTFNGFEGRSDGEKIDYILVSPDVQVIEAEIERNRYGGRYPSDHFPVSAVLRVCEGSK